jgi:hypothetical protein
MDPNSESDYALASGKSGVKPIPLSSKIGSTREGGRGASDEETGDGGAVKPNGAGYTFFGDASGKNEDTFHRPEVKAPTKSTLGDGA